MGKIAVLDENMVNMIAAGEVIERPASVVKELLENSIDAQAKSITVKIEDGGRKLISITDDGGGMDADDLQNAFMPHATSKIRTDEDLLNISTMGFRGEALASIASVSTVSMISRTADSIQANRFEMDCGNKGEVKPASGGCGTTVEVRNLFYKLPGRRKFLRTANTEMSHIIEQFTRIALSHSQLDMTLIHNSRQLHRLIPSTNLIDRIGQLSGKAVAADLIETQSSEKNIRISALMGKPTLARATSKFQYVFLNRRFIRDRFILHAIKEAYRGLIEPNKYPAVYLFLEMSPDAYDVNVHPTKVEVRFREANVVHSQVLAVLREKLLGMNLDVSAQLPSPSISLAEDSQTSHSEQARRLRITEAMAEFFKEHKPVGTSQQHFGFSGSAKNIVDFKPASAEKTSEAQIPAVTKKFLQVHNSYIITQSDEGFVIVDQHALHERIIYEELCRKISSGKLFSQRLLIPETIELSDAQAEAIKNNSELIEKLGIELEPFGPRTVAIQAFPSILDKVSPYSFVEGLIDMLVDKAGDLDPERLLHEVLDLTACKAAIKAGQRLTDFEIEQLLKDKETIARASRCPHGRPTTIKFSLKELEKQFKRTGF